MSIASKLSAIAFLFSCLETAFNSFPLVSSPGKAGRALRCADGRAALRAPLLLTLRFFQDLQSLCLLPSVLLPGAGLSFSYAMLQLEALEHLKLRENRIDYPLEFKTMAN